MNPKLEEKVLALRTATNDLYDIELNGWAVTHRFRCKNDYGTQMPPEELLFFCDLNFERCRCWTEEQIESFFKIIECVEESETDKMLLKNLQDIRLYKKSNPVGNNRRTGSLLQSEALSVSGNPDPVLWNLRLSDIA